MEEKELRKLNRVQLLELMYEQQTRIEELEKENESLKAELDDRNIILGKVGSIAEASLALTKVFDEAQKSADIYLDSIRNIYNKIRRKAAEEQKTNTAQTERNDSGEAPN